MAPFHNFGFDDSKQATLKVRGKALSSEQKVKVVTKAQTENPLYLKTLLEVRKLLFIAGFIMRVKDKNQIFNVTGFV